MQSTLCLRYFLILSSNIYVYNVIPRYLRPLRFSDSYAVCIYVSHAFYMPSACQKPLLSHLYVSHIHIMKLLIIIIIIIIIIICYHLYAVYLQLYTWNKPCFYGVQCCNYSVVTIYGTCDVISYVYYYYYYYWVCKMFHYRFFFLPSLVHHLHVKYLVDTESLNKRGTSYLQYSLLTSFQWLRKTTIKPLKSSVWAYTGFSNYDAANMLVKAGRARLDQRLQRA